jgi:[ribosomal protein S5]-alanine N-acetyltransferase
MTNAIAEIETPRLIGRALSWHDLDDLLRMHADGAVMATLGGMTTDEETKERIQRTIDHWDKNGFGLWTFRRKTDGRFVGAGGLHRVEVDGREEVEIAYVIAQEFWDQGFATEIAKTSIESAFKRLELTELVAFTLPTNLASRRVMEKAGFRYKRDIVWKDLPHVLYRITREEWQQV